MCLIFFICVMRLEHVSKLHFSSVIFFCIVVNHLSVTNGSVNKCRNVDHFSVKISMPAFLEQQDVDHFSVKILVVQYHLALHQDVDHLNVTILKLSNFSEPLTSPLFIYNVTRSIALKTFFIANERISMFWGCSLFFSYPIFVSLIFCIITTLFQISTRLKTSHSTSADLEVQPMQLNHCDGVVIMDMF